MQRSPSRSSTSALAALAALGVGVLSAACSDDPRCGPDNAPAIGLVAAGTSTTLSYGPMLGGVNNDCPASDAPAGVVSLTIRGPQSDATGGGGMFTLCVSRPDLLSHAPQALGHDVASAQVRVIDVTGTTAGCTYVLDATQPITGTASSTGLCGDGKDKAGFALTVDGTATLRRTCGAVVDTLAVTLRGRAAVAAE